AWAEVLVDAAGFETRLGRRRLVDHLAHGFTLSRASGIWRRRGERRRRDELADSRCRADGLRNVGAKLVLVDELVLDDGVIHVRRGHPFGRQERRGLLASRLAGRWLGRPIEQAGGRRFARPEDGRERDRVLGLEVDGLVDRPALVVLEDVGHTLLGCILARRRDLFGADAAVLEDRDDGIPEAIIRLDGGIDGFVGGVLLLEDGLPLGVVPAGRDLVADQGVAVTVGRASRQRRVGLSPDDRVIA